jgi:hypothetical protein
MRRPRRRHLKVLPTPFILFLDGPFRSLQKDTHDAYAGPTTGEVPNRVGQQRHGHKPHEKDGASDTSTGLRRVSTANIIVQGRGHTKDIDEDGQQRAWELVGARFGQFACASAPLLPGPLGLVAVADVS